MSDFFNPDFQDFIKALNQAEVEYVLIGGYAVSAHGYNRPTADLDIFVNPTKANYKMLVQAFQIFGMPMFGVTEERFLNTKVDEVFGFGRSPVLIELLTLMKGVEFSEAFEYSEIHIMDQIPVRVISYNHLIQAKKAAGRYKDLDDIENLEAERD